MGIIPHHCTEQPTTGLVAAGKFANFGAAPHCKARNTMSPADPTTQLAGHLKAASAALADRQTDWPLTFTRTSNI